jgi:hypothetical protein
LDVFATLARRTIETRSVMMHENAVARMEVAHCTSGFSDNPDRLMA